MKIVNSRLFYLSWLFSAGFSHAATVTWYDSDFTTPKGHTWINVDNPVYGGDVHIVNTSTATFSAAPGYGNSVLGIEKGGKLVADGHVEAIQGNASGHAVLVTDGGKAYFNGGLTAINTHIDNNRAAIGVGISGSELHVTGSTVIHSLMYGMALLSNTSSTFDGLVTIDARSSGVHITGSQNHFMQGMAINLTGDNAYGIGLSNETSSTTIDGPVNMNIVGNGSSGIIGYSSSSAAPQSIELTVNDPLTIYMKASGDNESNLYGIALFEHHSYRFKDTHITFDDAYRSKYEIGLYASGGSIDIDGALNIKTTDPAENYAIYAINGGTVTAAGVANIDGYVVSKDNSSVSLDMALGSVWQGAAGYINNSSIDIKMASSLWQMIDNSALTTLEVNSSTVSFLSTPGRFLTLTTGELQGAGAIFNMNVDLASITAVENAHGERIGLGGVNGDMLEVTNTLGVGHHYLSIANNSALATRGNEVLQVVSTPIDNVGNFTAGIVEAGGYEYRLRQSNNGNNQAVGWELYGEGRMTSTAQSTLSQLNIGYLLNYIDTQTLLQRMGDLREGVKRQTGNFWVRAYAGKANAFSGQALDGFHMGYSGTQLGIDREIELSSAVLYTGVMAGYTKGDPNYRTGSATAKGITTGLYATYLGDEGLYIDGIIKYSNIRNSFSIVDSQNRLVKGKTDSDGYGLSLEVGKRFMLAETLFYLEPQIQLSYQHQQGDKARAANGLNVYLSDYNSLLGRTSAVVGYKLSESETSRMHVYAKIGMANEFSGDVSYSLNGSNSRKYSFKGHWLDSGIGITSQLNKRHQIFGELDYAKGNRFDKTQLSLGYRYRF